jgi:hypothetical protein
MVDADALVERLTDIDEIAAGCAASRVNYQRILPRVGR